ncbi:NAD(P)/FAD-dependent oxidoreductase [uncultured Paraglaciecola sp.]|uniref:flavin-containing monooxygenase n=1 Tax=uncultured Paraglaciecola sp. TaxID=1765024 RepID=UPI0025F1724D|nr:NAD(P)/FAD-dependent oxidoreductase [uncultured Paraglaciecola sp.]
MSIKTVQVEVLIVGAGISGIGAAYHLQKHCPGKKYAIIEARSSLGGTWDLFRYPGIRSDSDMFTFGFNFKPWRTPKAISPSEDIKTYIAEAASENGIDKHILFEHKVISANWDSASAKWLTEIENVQTGECCQYTSHFLFSGAGYYNYEKGYTPVFKGIERFTGDIVHPQHWPQDLDYAGKNIIVIGSGATAVTLVPALAATAGHVTMLQRSPTYIASRPEQDVFANVIRRYLPVKLAYSIIRWVKILQGMLLFNLSRRRPEKVKKAIRQGVIDALGEDYPVDTHFNPSYQPWDQRACLIPDGDLFSAIKSGTASVVTEHIDTFTETGVKLQSGEELAADIIVTATGLNLEILSSYQLSVDQKPFSVADSYCYKGMMLNGLPNFAFSMGYTNASWTLKSDLVGQYVCRLINHMHKHHYDYCEPVLPANGIESEPFIDFTSGYITRALDKMPKQGRDKPWKLNQNYILDSLSLHYSSVVDDSIVFSTIQPNNPQPKNKSK